MSELPEVVWACAGDTAAKADVPPWWLVREARAGRLPSRNNGLGGIHFPVAAVVDIVLKLRLCGVDLPDADAPNPKGKHDPKSKVEVKCCRSCGRDTTSSHGTCARCLGDYRPPAYIGRPKRIPRTEDWSR